MTRFTVHQDVAVVEHDDATRKPREGGKVIPAMIERGGDTYVLARLASGALWTFSQGGGWAATTELSRWRLVPLCYSCDEPVTGEPVTEQGDPLKREWDSEDCREASAEASYEQRYQPGVAT